MLKFLLKFKTTSKLKAYIHQIISFIEQKNTALDMKLRTSWVFSFIGIAAITFAATRLGSFGLSNDPNPEKEAVLIHSIMEGLNRMHFQPKKVDDAFSKQVFDLYLKDIDSGKRFYNKADFQSMQKFENQLDDQATAGTFEFFNLSVQLMDASIAKTGAWYKEILAKPMSFEANDNIQVDGEKLDWAKDDTEMRKRWEDWMRYEVLSRITNEQEKQEKADFKGDKKTFEQLEIDQRKKVLDVYDKWYKRLGKLDRVKRMESYFNAITNVFDPHTGYYSPKQKEDFDIQMSGKLEGIGARLQSDGEKTTITDIVPGTPSWKEGTLQSKDVVLKVGQGDDEPIDIMGWDISDVVAKIRGPKGTVVTLTIQKPDGSEKVVKLTRDVVVMEDGFAKSLILRNGTPSTDKIGYIYLPKFYADFTQQGSTSCAVDVAKEVEKLKAESVKGIILDLRNNGGGSLRDVVTMSGLFIEQGPIVQVKSRGRKAEILEDNDSRVQYGGPLIVMVNGFSASASEIIAAAMQDYGRAVIVGSNSTYGKGTVQRFFDLDNAVSDASLKPMGEMKLTVQKFYRINGKTTQFDGVKPDIILPDSYNLLDLGERENDYPLESNTIDAVTYTQNAYHIADLGKLLDASKKRVTSDPTFKLITDNSFRMKKQKEQTTFPLSQKTYSMWSKKQDDEADKYENMFKPIESFVIENVAADLQTINSDTSRVARNLDWMKDKKKDIQLYETLQIMQDMLRADGVAGKQ
jgi:carboxyl-terminal processing protease